MSNQESRHAELLNNLNDMQHSLHYAARRPVLAAAESLIVSQEREIARLQEELKKKIPLTSLSLIRTAELIWPILLTQEAGEISEAKAGELIGKDIVSLREIKAKAIKSIMDLLESLPSPLSLLLESTKVQPKSSESPAANP